MNILKEVIEACPRCGSTGVLCSDSNGQFKVCCVSCSESSLPYGTIEDAISEWNYNCTEDGL